MVNYGFVYGIIFAAALVFVVFLIFLVLYFRKATHETRNNSNPGNQNGGAFENGGNEIPENYKTRGEEADSFFKEGQYTRAKELYTEIINKVIESRAVDVFVISKCVLGLLISLLKEDNLEEAFKLWSSEPDNTMGIGVYGLENGQVSSYDAALYAMVSAVFYAVGTGDPEQNANQVDACMTAACSFYQKKEFTGELEIALNNWKRCLLLVYEDGIIHLAHMEAIKKFSGKLEARIEADKIDFPAPAKWVIDWKVKGTTVYTPDGDVN